MTIQELINNLPFKIVQRGQSYFDNGNILQLNQGRNGTWHAEIEGNYGNYEVEIKTDNKGNVSNYYCDCPYDGTICKHIAAVALAINEIFENYDYRGFIDYRNSHKAMYDVTHFQMKADDYYSKGNLNEAFCISAAIAMEGLKAIQYMDDSSGDCGRIIYEAFRVIENILNNTTSAELKERIFNWLYEQVQNSDYNSYGVGDSLEPLFFETAASLKQLDVPYNFIDAKIIQLNKEDGWSKNYYLQSYLGQKINLLQSEGRTTEADNIIDAYLNFENFRH